MKTELKKAILNFIVDNIKEFQINNVTIQKFKAYIYDAEGNYLIGGKEVRIFINDAIKLITQN